jgi:hypothetical protein
MVLGAGIGKRGRTEHNIPTEYAYLPLLAVILIVMNRDVSSHKCVESHRVFQVATLIPFVLIISIYPCNSHLYNMSYPGNSLEIYPLYVLLVSIYAIPTTRNTHLVASALSKSLVLIIGISCMSAVSGPDMSTFQRLHDFYGIRIVSHVDHCKESCRSFHKVGFFGNIVCVVW